MAFWKNIINWIVNLSRAPWWGGQVERIIGLTKQALLKAIGKMKLTQKELEIEITLNNRPLRYIEDEIHTPVLIPNLVIL